MVQHVFPLIIMFVFPSVATSYSLIKRSTAQLFVNMPWSINTFDEALALHPLWTTWIFITGLMLTVRKHTFVPLGVVSPRAISQASVIAAEGH